MKLILLIPLLLTTSVFGQSNDLGVKSKLSIEKSDLIVELEIKNENGGVYYFNTEGVWIALDPSDSLAGFTAYLESKSGKFIPSNIFIEFKHYDNLNKEVRKLKNKHPKIKTSPKDCLILNRQELNLLTIKIPLEYWKLEKRNEYRLTVIYRPITSLENLNTSKLEQVEKLSIDVGTFVY